MNSGDVEHMSWDDQAPGSLRQQHQQQRRQQQPQQQQQQQWQPPRTLG
jgi:hypothetical protein